MPMTWSPDVTLVNVKEKFRNVMKCLKIPSKFAKSLTCGASISWGRSRLHEGTSTYSWPSITCLNRISRIVKTLVLAVFHKSFTSSASVWESRTDNQEKDEKQSQNDKTGLGMEKTVKDKPNQSRKVNQVKKST
ncbi:hypothetical protein Tco_0543178 [Tanacetum coccineum]